MARCLSLIAQLESTLGDSESARRTYLRGIDIVQALARAKPDDNPLRLRMAAQYGNLANHFVSRNDGPQARNA